MREALHPARSPGATPDDARLFEGDFAIEREVGGDSGGYERPAGGVSGADVAPMGIGDGVRTGRFSVTPVFGAVSAQSCVRRRVSPRLGQDVAAVAQCVGPRP